jgi:hypothetical protein
MLTKVSTYLAETEYGYSAIPLFGPADATFEKAASSGLLPEVVNYINTLRPKNDSQYVLVNAMGAGEFYGSNVNMDWFEESGLIHKPDNWTGNPLVDKALAKEWTYGFPTFYEAGAFAHHKNKDRSRAYGDVELTAWNPHMRRVELVICVSKQKCEEFGGTAVWDKLKSGAYPDVSMGSRVCYDLDSITTDWATYKKALATFDAKKHKYPGLAVVEFHKKLEKETGKGIRGLSITRKDYQKHQLFHANKILPDGRKVFVYNPYPRFFDISFVFIGADRTAKVMVFITQNGVKYNTPSAIAHELSEKKAEDEGVEKTAEAHKLQGHIDFQGLGIDVENRKGSVRKGVDEDGTPWRTKMKHPYGYIEGTKGADGEEVDAYVGPVKDAPKAYVVHQHKADGTGFDEDKVMLGFGSKEEAEKAYLAHYDDPKFLGPISEVPVERLKELIDSGKTLKKISFVQKSARVTKKGEIEKSVIPSWFAGKAVPLMTKEEKDIPKELLDTLGTLPLKDALSTTAGLGIVLRPREFQRIVIINAGKPGLADQLEKQKILFPETDDIAECPMGIESFLPALAQLLLPLMQSRSALSPMVERRLIMRISTSPHEKDPSFSTDALRTIGASYNGYRKKLMSTVAGAQDLLEKSAPKDEELKKVSSAPVECIFTPLTVSYLTTAFLDEVPHRL